MRRGEGRRRKTVACSLSLIPKHVKRGQLAQHRLPALAGPYPRSGVFSRGPQCSPSSALAHSGAIRDVKPPAWARTDQNGARGGALGAQAG